MAKSREELLDFLDYAISKGLINRATGSSRKAAVNRVLGVLEDDEATNVFTIDLDGLMTRFINLHSNDYTPDSLAVYKSRVRSAIDDFKTYTENPLGFKGSNATSRSAKTKTGLQKTGKETGTGGSKRSTESATVSAVASSDILPIPIRQNVTVRIHGLPFDLTAAEAARIAAVVQAMATPDLS